MNWTTVLLALIAALPATIAAINAGRSARKAGAKIEHLTVEVNSRLTQLLEVTASAAGAAGELRGRAARRSREADASTPEPDPT